MSGIVFLPPCSSERLIFNCDQARVTRGLATAYHQGISFDKSGYFYPILAIRHCKNESTHFIFDALSSTAAISEGNQSLFFGHSSCWILIAQRRESNGPYNLGACDIHVRHRHDVSLLRVSYRLREHLKGKTMIYVAAAVAALYLSTCSRTWFVRSGSK
jgi:hypothetical protein